MLQLCAFTHVKQHLHTIINQSLQHKKAAKAAFFMLAIFYSCRLEI
jgi:hypothetical protein